MTTHAKLSPSGASRWLRCLASVTYAGDPDDSSEYADELKDVIGELTELGKSKGRDAIAGLLAEYGAKDLAGIPAAAYAEIVAKSQARRAA